VCLVRRRVVLALTLLGAAAAAAVPVACGSDTGASQPTQLAPAASVLYGEATIKPDGDQKQALEDLAKKLPGGKSPGRLARDVVASALEESGSNLDYDKDVKPWLGDKAAYFAAKLTNGEVSAAAVLLKAEDEDAANDAIDKAAKGKGRQVAYKDVAYRRVDGKTAAGVVDGYLVAGNERGLKAAIDVDKEDARPIESSDAYKQALKGVPEDRLGFLYLNTPMLFDSIKGTLGSGALGAFGKLFSEPYVVTADADSDGVELTTTLPQSLSSLVIPLFGEGTDLIEGLPADSWAALAQPNLGKTLDYYVDLFAAQAGGRDQIEQGFRQATGLDLERDVIGWMGDFGVFARGSDVSTVNGALVIETSDQAASDRALAALRRQLSKEGEIRVGQLTAPGGGEGYTLRSSDVPKPIHAFRKGNRVVLAYGDDAARDAVEAASPLADSDQFKLATGALGDGYKASTYVAMQPILDLVESAGKVTGDPEWQKTKPYLQAIGAIVGGTRKEGDRLVQKIRLTVP
jgi:hypothetical protein